MQNRRPNEETVSGSFDDAMRLCWQVAALVKYGHFEDAAQEVRLADFLGSEVKEEICRRLEFRQEFPLSLVLEPFIKRMRAEEGRRDGR